jgi:hypothetical protein
VCKFLTEQVCCCGINVSEDDSVDVSAVGSKLKVFYSLVLVACLIPAVVFCFMSSMARSIEISVTG